MAVRWSLACALGACAVTAGHSAGANPAVFREAFLGAELGKSASPPTGRYQTDAGGAFIFDRSSARALLKFDGSPEIWVLTAAPGPRGDVIYRNDLGEEMLRSTRLGGMTVFTQKRPDGSAAAFFGASPPLKVPQMSMEAFLNRFEFASDRASRAAQHQIGFETVQDAEPDTAGAVADAAMVASLALVDMAQRRATRAAVARIIDVVIAQGARANAVLRKSVLVITIDPRQGVYGRPSSRWIERAAGAR